MINTLMIQISAGIQDFRFNKENTSITEVVVLQLLILLQFLLSKVEIKLVHSLFIYVSFIIICICSFYLFCIRNFT